MTQQDFDPKCILLPYSQIIKMLSSIITQDFEQ